MSTSASKPPTLKQQWIVVARTKSGYPSLAYGPFVTIEGAQSFAESELKGHLFFDIVPSIPIREIGK